VVRGPAYPHLLELSSLVPRHARIDSAWYVLPRRGRPAQILVEWHRVERVAPKGVFYRDEAWHLVLWTASSARGYETSWRPHVVIAGPYALDPIDDVRLADVTGDGRPEVVAADWQGNHACGPRRVVATFGSRPRTILSASWCETFWSVERGALRIEQASYRAGDSMCCPSFELYATYRWNGRRLVISHRRLVRRHY
jgi:hypothetical protein